MSMGKSIQIDDDLDTQKKSWKFEKAGKIVLWVIIALSITGIFGSGPLSLDSVKSEDLELKYAFFERQKNSTELSIVLGKKYTSVDTINISINEDFVKKIRIEAISPIPVKSDIIQGFIRFFFKSNVLVNNTTVTIHLKYYEPGYYQNTIRINDDGIAGFKQLVYP
jgi:hypothetical protein